MDLDKQDVQSTEDLVGQCQVLASTERMHRFDTNWEGNSRQQSANPGSCGN